MITLILKQLKLLIVKIFFLFLFVNKVTINSARALLFQWKNQRTIKQKERKLGEKSENKWIKEIGHWRCKFIIAQCLW